MSGSLIIYSSTDGQTKIICEKIKNFSKNSESIKLISLEEANDFNLQSYEDIIIGASIRYGKHNKNLYKFISSNKETLEKKRSAFFSVNVVARKPEKNTPETNPYMKKFLKFQIGNLISYVYLLAKLIIQIIVFLINILLNL